jgi:hypothetical protein
MNLRRRVRGPGLQDVGPVPSPGGDGLDVPRFMAARPGSQPWVSPHVVTYGRALAWIRFVSRHHGGGCGFPPGSVVLCPVALIFCRRAPFSGGWGGFSASEGLSAVTGDLSSAVQDISPATEDVSPAVGRVSPVVEDVSPTTEDVSPTAEGVSPTAEGVSPTAEDVSSAVVETSRTGQKVPFLPFFRSAALKNVKNRTHENSSLG